MSDPITAAMVGAGISGGTSLLQGKKLGTSLRNAAIGGALGGAGGYLGGAMGGAGGAVGNTTGTGTGAVATQGAANMGNIGMANTFNTGAGTALGQSGIYAQGLNPELYTGSRGLFDVATGSTLGGQGPATFAGGGGYDTSIFGGLKRGISNVMPGDVLMSNPVGYGNLALNAYGAMNQSQAPLQPSPMQSAQQLISQQGPAPTPQFNSLLQASRRPILIG